MVSKTMKAIGVAKYGAIDNLESRDVPRPERPTGMDMLIEHVAKACSVNPIDTKVRNGTYDDAPGTNSPPARKVWYSSITFVQDYYKYVPNDFHIIGFDGAGTVLEIGTECTNSKPGDDIFFVGSTTRQCSNAEYILVNKRLCAKKPKSLDFVEAASMGLTFGTTFQSLVHRLEIKQNENAGILIMGATHVVNHKADLESQIKALKLDVPIKYVYVVARTEQYIHAVRKICAPFAKVCSIVQAKFDLYGTEWMSKLMTFSWDWLGTSACHHTDTEKYQQVLANLTRYIEDGKLVPNLNRCLKLNLAGLKEAHRLIESATTVGKLSLGVDEASEGATFV
ncbi:hypothetical protein N7539_008301 [Penicillium diatomitis]|uniref:Enoyl reductase (ER) domain-containing protein n=1 Tax=Penicillium diatomitis TaxID=2819901 RepID=A0A9W9WTK2_9EURO|nr:uncharacterized protein N7539_008301 [Penicillium diatomitis]KAJ5475235.1 hypothetical protein N7539_008301 [Penicillium diatomitis]